MSDGKELLDAAITMLDDLMEEKKGGKDKGMIERWFQLREDREKIRLEDDLNNLRKEKELWMKKVTEKSEVISPTPTVISPTPTVISPTPTVISPTPTLKKDPNISICDICRNPLAINNDGSSKCMNEGCTKYSKTHRKKGIASNRKDIPKSETHTKYSKRNSNILRVAVDNEICKLLVDNIGDFFGVKEISKGIFNKDIINDYKDIININTYISNVLKSIDEKEEFIGSKDEWAVFTFYDNEYVFCRTGVAKGRKYKIERKVDDYSWIELT